MMNYRYFNYRLDLSMVEFFFVNLVDVIFFNVNNICNFWYVEVVIRNYLIIIVIDIV